MPPEVDSPARKVWVLMFDQLPAEDADRKTTEPAADTGTAASNEPVFGPFDDLDLQSAFFEQYMLQDARKSAAMTDILGGAEAVSRFAARIRTANKSAHVLRFVCASGRSGEVPLPQSQGNFLTNHGISTRLVERIIPTSSNACDEIEEADFHDDPELCSALTADLVWVDAQTGSAKYPQAAAAMLKFIQRLRFETTPDASVRPVLIVTTLRGNAWGVAAPFIPGLSESQIHVPLWIGNGTGHACRIQALTGSFDLLPTLTEYLTGTSPARDPAAVDDDKLPDGSVRLSGRPVSLVCVCEHQRMLPDRLLHLTGDSWIALRTQQYLLVHPGPKPNPSDASSQSPDEERTTSRRLYLKPEDVWNVNDAIVAYAGIADQMEATAAEAQRIEADPETLRNAGHDCPASLT